MTGPLDLAELRSFLDRLRRERDGVTVDGIRYTGNDTRKAMVYTLALLAGEGRNFAREVSSLNSTAEALVLGWMSLHKLNKL